ncbi:MAG: hypothetical protein JWM58_2615 [Rhizobium sp.]|nr:hypothetical protein [Rhizobium sp.]
MGRASAWSMIVRAAFGMLCMAGVAAAQDVVTYDGVCDASAGVALDDTHFVMADNNTNALRVYGFKGGKVSQPPFDLENYLGIERDDDGKVKEADIEAAAAIGKRIWWITSHGRNNKGNVKKERFRLFATDVSESGGQYTFEPVGTAYSELMEMILRRELYKKAGLEEAEPSKPEEGGINIEGLAEAPDNGLYLGLRSPVGARGAMIIPILKPENVLKGKKLKLDAPIYLELGGRGIRSLEKVGDHYLVIAGPAGNEGAFSLYRWNGKSDAAMKLKKIRDFPSGDNLKPESVFALIDSQDADDVYVLSDDGDRFKELDSQGKKCEDVDNAANKHFRGFRENSAKP